MVSEAALAEVFAEALAAAEIGRRRYHRHCDSYFNRAWSNLLIVKKVDPYR